MSGGSGAVHGSLKGCHTQGNRPGDECWNNVRHKRGGEKSILTGSTGDMFSSRYFSAIILPILFDVFRFGLQSMSGYLDGAWLGSMKMGASSMD